MSIVETHVRCPEGRCRYWPDLLIVEFSKGAIAAEAPADCSGFKKEDQLREFLEALRSMFVVSLRPLNLNGWWAFDDLLRSLVSNPASDELRNLLLAGVRDAGIDPADASLKRPVLTPEQEAEIVSPLLIRFSALPFSLDEMIARLNDKLGMLAGMACIYKVPCRFIELVDTTRCPVDEPGSTDAERPCSEGPDPVPLPLPGDLPLPFAVGDWDQPTSDYSETWGLEKMRRVLTGDGAFDEGEGRTVAMLDTGVDAAHPWLKGRAANGFPAFPSFGRDPEGHGTHVAGVLSRMLAKSAIRSFRVVNGSPISDNGIRFVPVDPGLYYTALEEIGQNPAGIAAVNISVGGAEPLARFESFAIARIANAGIPVVAAAGNHDGNNPATMFPAAAKGVIGVSACVRRELRDVEMRVWRRSNQVRANGCAAPGYNIYSSLPTYQNLSGRTLYGWKHGTSMAAPFITALAAMGRLALQFPAELGAQEDNRLGLGMPTVAALKARAQAATDDTLDPVLAALIGKIIDRTVYNAIRSAVKPAFRRTLSEVTAEVSAEVLTPEVTRQQAANAGLQSTLGSLAALIGGTKLGGQ